MSMCLSKMETISDVLMMFLQLYCYAVPPMKAIDILHWARWHGSTGPQHSSKIIMVHPVEYLLQQLPKLDASGNLNSRLDSR